MSTAWLVFVLPASNNTGSEQVSLSLTQIDRAAAVPRVSRSSATKNGRLSNVHLALGVISGRGTKPGSPSFTLD